MNAVVWHDDGLKSFYEAGHSPSEILAYLKTRGALEFPVQQSGLLSAISDSGAEAQASGMLHAWVRDNCHVAMALKTCGELDIPIGIARAMIRVFSDAKSKMEAIIGGSADPEVVANRPPARVDALTLEPDEGWANDQNDSVGAMLKLVCELALDGSLRLSEEENALLDVVVDYLKAIRYWEDDDSGYWEEARKVNASSIGTVVAGLKAYVALRTSESQRGCVDNADALISHGMAALEYILPNETVSPKARRRECDAADIFLIEPLGVVSGRTASEIVERCERALVRERGVARYQGDSYWTKDYRRLFGLGARTADFSENPETRDRFAVSGAEAQWTLFDPMLAVFWLKWFMGSGNKDDRERACWHYQRTLGQFIEVDGCLKDPEAYFLEDGKWVPNDHVPLLWSEALVKLMLHEFEKVGE